MWHSRAEDNELNGPLCGGSGPEDKNMHWRCHVLPAFKLNNVIVSHLTMAAPLLTTDGGIITNAGDGRTASGSLNQNVLGFKNKTRNDLSAQSDR